MAHDDFLKLLDDDAKCAAFAKGFIRELVEPAFGARSKGEIEALAIRHLVAAGFLNPDGAAYAVARALNVSSAKARNIILQYQLRTNLADADLDEKLRTTLAATRYGRDGTYLAFGLESPILQEHLFARLKERKTFADTSFSKEIVRLPVEAFVDFVGWRFPTESETVRRDLVKAKLIEDTSFTGVAKGIMRTLLVKVGDKALGNLGDVAADRLSEFIKSLLTGDGGGAAAVAASGVVEA